MESASLDGLFPSWQWGTSPQRTDTHLYASTQISGVEVTKDSRESFHLGTNLHALTCGYFIFLQTGTFSFFARKREVRIGSFTF